MSKATVEIGAYVLESLTTGMYTEPLDAIRELVQNSADSLRLAVESGLINPGQARIGIHIKADERTVLVRDNGLGIQSDTAEKRLLAIGKTTKSLETDAGFRGIGRLASIAYCDSLVFRTSAAGDTKCCTLTLDCVAMRAACAPSARDNNELSDVFASNSAATYEEVPASEHFFEVWLKGVCEEAGAFLDEGRLEGYLAQVAPVEYDSQRFVYRGSIEDWLADKSIPLSTVILQIHGNDNRQVFKPYRTHYRTLRSGYDVHIKGVKFFPDDPMTAGYWGWYADTDLMGVLDDEESAGFRLRRNNIQLGSPARIAELFAEVAESDARFNKWFIGEVHVLSPDCIPNARRDGLELAGDWPRIREELVAFLRGRSQEVRAVSEARNRPTAKVVAEIDGTVNSIAGRLETPMLTGNEKKTLLAKIEKAKDKVAKSLKSSRTPEDVAILEPLTAQLDDIAQRVQSAKEERDVLSGLDRKQRKLVREILDSLFEVLDEQTYRRATDAIAARLGCTAENLKG